MNKLGLITFGVQVTWKTRQIFEDYWKDLMKLQSKFFWFLKTVKIQVFLRKKGDHMK